MFTVYSINVLYTYYHLFPLFQKKTFWGRHCYHFHSPDRGGGCSAQVFFFFFFNYLFILLYNIVLVLPYIDLNPPWVHMCSPSWTPLPTPSPSHSSGSSQCTSPISLGLKCVSGESLILQGLARSALRMSMAHGCSSSSLEIPDPPPWQLKMSFHLKLKPRCRALTTGSSAWGSDSSLLNYSTFYFYGELNSQVVVLIFS